MFRHLMFTINLCDPSTAAESEQLNESRGEFGGSDHILIILFVCFLRNTLVLLEPVTPRELIA